MSVSDTFKSHLSGDALEQAKKIANKLDIPLKKYLTEILHNVLPPHTEEALELSRKVAEYVGVPFMQYLAETIQDVENRTGYKNKPLDTSPLSLRFASRHHVLYPIITKETLQKMYKEIMEF